jgi:hypothetical protein
MTVGFSTLYPCTIRLRFSPTAVGPSSSSSTLITPLISDGGTATGSESGPPRLGGGGSQLVEEIDANGEAGRAIGASR